MGCHLIVTPEVRHAVYRHFPENWRLCKGFILCMGKYSI